MKQHTIRWTLMVLLSLSTLWSSAQNYKGIWGRLDAELGMVLNEVPEPLRGTNYEWPAIGHSEGSVVGYHFNDRWSIGLGINDTAYRTLHQIKLLSLSVEGQYRPFSDQLAPLGLNLRLGIPMSYKINTTTGLAVSWAFRNKLWHIVGAELATGVNFIPYTSERYASAEVSEKSYKHTLVSPFFRFSIRLN